MQAGSRRRAILAALILVSAGCGGQRIPPDGPSIPSNSEVATALVVEQFLRAANTNDLDTMARLFGTRDGPTMRRDSKDLVDRQMFTLASILRNDGYTIAGRNIVPGRRDEATQLIVRMRFREREVDVPWTLVYSKDGSWLVEQIEIQRITSGR
ncbi:MAG: hypothetical protein L0271_14790 [Gemmatimonadetes bacterium]|nr:hypothetical protein [Gemmatimonadota bacterium]